MAVDAFITEEFLNTFAGTLIGEGSGRKVFDLPLLPGFVVKIEECPRSFQNVVEWTVWQTVQSTPQAKWFAPCAQISPNGRVLVMAKTAPWQGRLPRKMPGYLTDFKRENFGMLNGRMVVHDYGVNLLVEMGLLTGAKNAVWIQ